MDAENGIIDLSRKHLPAMLLLRLATTRAHHELLPHQFVADPEEAVLARELRGYLGNWNPFQRRCRFAIGQEDRGELAGYALYSTEDRPREPGTPRGRLVTITDIAVVPEHRRRGLAHRLVDAVRDRFTDAPGQTDIFAHIWTGNDASASLFARAGFAPLYTLYKLPMAEPSDGA